MAAEVRAVVGPALCGKTSRLLAGYRQRLAASPPGSTLWIAPTQRSAFDIRGRLLDGQLAACFSPGVLTFDQFASAVVHASDALIRPLEPAMKRHLVRRLIETAHASNKLKHFAPIAETSGLVDLMSQWISELKRLEIWPEELRAACRQRGLTPKDRELLELYEEYQRALTEHQLYDAEGRFWSARELLREGQRRPFDNLRLVVVDGFTDFTRTQHEILEILARRVEELVVSLPLEAPCERPELFAKSQATLDELGRRHPELEVETLPRPAEVWPALAHLERELFKNPREVKPARDANRIEIVAAGRQAGEIELVARRIKELLTSEPSPSGRGRLRSSRVRGGESESESQSDGPLTPTLSQREREKTLTPALSQREREKSLAATLCDSQREKVRPGDVAVVFRSLEQVAPLVEEIFGELGIPVAIEAGQPLEASPAVASLVSLLMVDLEDWPFRRLLALLGNNFFRPRWDEWEGIRTQVRAERVVRALQLPSGRQTLLRKLEKLAADAERSAGASGQGTLTVGSELNERIVAAGSELNQASSDDFNADFRLGRLRGDAAAVLPFFRRLAATLDELPRSATPAEWVAALERLSEATGFGRALDTGAAPGRPSRERLAWERLCRALAAGEELSRWLGESPPKLDRAQLVETLLDLAAGEELPGGIDEAGRVRVLSAPSARALAVPYLFVAGLSENAFPSRLGERLYSDAEYQQLHEAGLPVVLRSQRNQDEMLLFYEVLTRARRFLHLSYPALDEKAEPLLPSPYLVELEQALGPAVRRSQAAELSPLPPTSEPQSASDFRLQAVADALEGDCRLLAGLVALDEGPGDARLPVQPLESIAQNKKTGRGGGKKRSREALPGQSLAIVAERRPALAPGLADNLLAALGVIAERSRREGFGAHEGILASPAASGRLAERFGPERLWSASHLESYARCPYEFFLRKVLHVEPVEELALETDYLQRGRLLHDTLAAVHRRLKAEGKTPCELEADELSTACREILKVLARLDEDEGSLERGLREIDCRLLGERFGLYHAQHLKYDARFEKSDFQPVPTHFEVSFGLPLPESRDLVDPLSCEAPLVITSGGTTIKLAGRIDRIDVGWLGGQPVFNVVDYKSGTKKTKKKKSTPKQGEEEPLDGTMIQLEVYAIAAEELLLAPQQARAYEGGYWFVQEAGYVPWVRVHEAADGQLRPAADWLARRERLEQKIVELVTGIQGGQFPVYSRDDQCTGRCPYCTVCRINQVRSLEKTWPLEPAPV